MCKYGQISFIYYDLNTCEVTRVGHHEESLLPSLHFPMPIDNQCTNIIMSKQNFLLTPSMEGFNDFLPPATNWLKLSQCYGM